MRTRIVQRVIPVHPPEADGIAIAFGDARINSNAVLIRLRSLYGALDLDWEGVQKTRFLGESGGTLDRFVDILLPGLANWRDKYQSLTTDQVIETVEYY
jgi:hypothetical protein